MSRVGLRHLGKKSCSSVCAPHGCVSCRKTTHSGRTSVFIGSGTSEDLNSQFGPRLPCLCMWPSPGGAHICSVAAGFLGEKSYFWSTRVSSDVTSASSSSGLGSSLAPEILLSLSCCSERGAESSDACGVGWGEEEAVATLPLIQWWFFWMTDAA